MKEIKILGKISVIYGRSMLSFQCKNEHEEKGVFYIEKDRKRNKKETRLFKDHLKTYNFYTPFSQTQKNKQKNDKITTNN